MGFFTNRALCLNQKFMSEYKPPLPVDGYDRTFVVLGGGGNRRVAQAYRIYSTIPFVENKSFFVLTGLPPQVDGMSDYLIANGVPASRIIREEKSKTTGDHARYISKFLKNNIMLVTDKWHLHRASKLFKVWGFKDVVLLASDHNATPKTLQREASLYYTNILLARLQRLIGK